MGDEQQPAEEGAIGMAMDDEAWQLIDSSSAFPPNHHEGLPLSSSSPPPAPSPPPPPPPLMEEEDDEPSSIIRRAMSSGVAARLYACVCFGIRFWKVASVVGVAALALVYTKKKMQQWWRRRRPLKKAAAAAEEDTVVSRLILLIKERDKRISQLLLQIARMNQLLLTRRTVPVLRVASHN